MSKYLNDPREMAIRPESGITLEEDNRIEVMYHWGAKVLDLCDLPVDEYMKPMTVNCNGGGGSSDDTGSSVTKRSVSMKISVISPAGDIISQNGDIIGVTDGDGTWRVRWTWDRGFNGSLVSMVKVYDENHTEYVVGATISDNGNKQYETVIDCGNNTINLIGAYGVGEQGSEIFDATGKTTTIIDENTETEFEINIEINGTPSITVYDIYYGNACKNDSVEYSALGTIDMISSMDDDGYDFYFTIPASNDYLVELSKYDGGQAPYNTENADELWDEWSEQYENEYRHTLRVYIPVIIEDQYEFSLYNDNSGHYIQTEMVKSGVKKTYNNAEYSEYVNSNTKYLYDDIAHTFKMRFIMIKK